MQIAIIPARGGSKRIPRKNIRPFAGKPMICWPIETALASGLFDDVIVSTDDEEIMDVARQSGASVPFRRPADLSHDQAPARGVINHAIVEAERLHKRPVTLACCLYAISAFIRSEDLVAARAQLLADQPADFVFAALNYAHPVHRAMVLDARGRVEMLFPEHGRTRSQDLPQAFHDAAQFYWGTRAAFMEDHVMFSERSRPFLLDRTQAADIDSPEDWTYAERLMILRQTTEATA